MNPKIYLFKQDKYVQIDAATKAVDPGFPRSIAQDWRGMKEAGFDSDLDDAEYLNGNLYFFKGGKYVEYDLSTGAGQPQLVTYFLKNLPEEFQSGFDGCTIYTDDVFWILKGTQTTRCQLDSLDFKNWAGNNATSGNWSQLPSSFDHTVDAALTNYDTVPFTKPNRVILFKNDQMTVYGGSAQPISGYWKGLDADAYKDFASGIQAAVQLPDEMKAIPAPNPSGGTTHHAVFYLPAHSKFSLTALANLALGQGFTITMNDQPLDKFRLEPKGVGARYEKVYQTAATASTIRIYINFDSGQEIMKTQVVTIGKVNFGLIGSETVSGSDFADAIVMLAWPIV